MAIIDNAGVNDVPQAETEADTIERVNDGLEELAAHTSSLHGLLCFLGHRCESDLNQSATFFALANNLEQVTDNLNSLVERLAKFEPLTVTRAGRAVQS
jgi:hypothetical protein